MLNRFNDISSAPFSTWVLLLWEGGSPNKHREITFGSVVINNEFRRDQFWNGYEYRSMDNIIGWMHLPEMKLENE